MEPFLKRQPRSVMPSKLCQKQEGDLVFWMIQVDSGTQTCFCILCSVFHGQRFWLPWHWAVCGGQGRAGQDCVCVENLLGWLPLHGARCQPRRNDHRAHTLEPFILFAQWKDFVLFYQQYISFQQELFITNCWLGDFFVKYSVFAWYMVPGNSCVCANQGNKLNNKRHWNRLLGNM